MTIHKTAAIQAGIMPDFRGAGVVLCRSSQWTAADDSVVSGDTLQMVPIPSGAKILRLFMGFGALPAGFTGEDVGYGGRQRKDLAWKFHSIVLGNRGCNRDQGQSCGVSAYLHG